MRGSDRAYESLLQALEQNMPEVAQQVRDEVARGRPELLSALAPSDFIDRQQRIREARLPSMERKDVAVRPYSPDERLRLLLEALQTLADSMAESREALLRLLEEADVEARVVFAESEGDVEQVVDLQTDTRSSQRTRPEVVQALRDAIASVRPEL